MIRRRTLALKLLGILIAASYLNLSTRAARLRKNYYSQVSTAHQEESIEL
jgi:hypothetical protein